MGFFDFFTKDAKAKSIEQNLAMNNTAHAKTQKQTYLGDLQKTQLLDKLFQVSLEKRDEKWKTTFLENVAEASFRDAHPQVIEGPDGFLYFQLFMPEPYKEFQCFTIQHLAEDFLLDKGLGVVINSHKQQPDWVFSYGAILNYHLNHEFYRHELPAPPPPEIETLEKEEKVFVGQPSENFLSKAVRRNLRDFIKRFNIEDAKIFIMARQVNGETVQELVFNLTPHKFKNQLEFETLMRGISWFLPSHYRISAMEEKEFSDNFEAL